MKLTCTCTLYGDPYVKSHKDYLKSHPKLRIHDFTHHQFTCTITELYNFLAIVIIMGIISFPKIASFGVPISHFYGP